MSVCKFLSKYILYLFNLLSLISAVGILSIAVILNQKLYNLSNFISTQLNTTPQVLFLIGLGLFIVALIGLCGVLKDSGCLLTLFSILLSIILIGELVLAGFVYHDRNNMEQYALNTMNYTMSLYNKTGYEPSTQTWDYIQCDMKCCGIFGPKDWRPFINDKLPTTCCSFVTKNGTCTESNSYEDGCFKKLESYLEDKTQLLIETVIGFAFVQLLAILLACCRKCCIREEYETV